MKSPIDSLLLPEIYFEDEAGRYLVPKAGGGYRILPAGDLRIWLIRAGFNPNAPKGSLSEVDEKRLSIQETCGVDVAMPLAGYPQGLVVNGNLKILVTSSPQLPVPVKGEFPTIRALLNGMFVEDGLQQVEVLFAWLKRANESLRSGHFAPGQALCLCGPPNSGKSLLQLLITEILGGRSARAYAFLTKSTEFNRDLFEAEHLMIEDDLPSSDARSRRNLGSMVKNITVNVTQRFHAKGKDAKTVRPFWRLSISVNDNPDDLLVLPPLDESVSDKLIILRVHLSPFPMPTDTAEAQAAFWERLKSEVPAFLGFLSEWQIPAALQNQRFGVVSFQHPALVDALTDLQPEQRLLRIIDHVIFARNLRRLDTPSDPHIHLPPVDKEWNGTAEELESELRTSDKYGGEVAKLFGTAQACGSYLRKLADLPSPRVTSKKLHGYTRWKIEAPSAPATTNTQTEEADTDEN